MQWPKQKLLDLVNQNLQLLKEMDQAEYTLKKILGPDLQEISLPSKKDRDKNKGKPARYRK